MKYIINLDFASWHAANDSKRKRFSASISQLHNTLQFNKTLGKHGILTGISLFTLHSLCLLLDQFAKIISFPPSSTGGLMSVLLK